MSHDVINSINAPLPEALSELLAHAENTHGSMSLVAPDQRRLSAYMRDPATAEITDFRLEEQHDEEEGDKTLLNGQLLLSAIERQARERGIRWLIATSGQNGNETVTEFFNAVFGKAIAMDDDYDGPNFGRQIWLREIALKED